MNFSELNFSDELLSVLDSKKFMECTPIQEKSIPVILEGKDVAGLAQTGTGKTAAYMLPLMQRVLNSTQNREGSKFSNWKKGNIILVLVPTRELTEQVVQFCQLFQESTQLRATAIYGGTSYDKQKKDIGEHTEFVVATPGRLIDLYKNHIIDLKNVRGIVFDEADRMFDMGFQDDMKYILRRVPKDRQFLVYSATLNFDVLNVAYQFGSTPVEVNVSRDQAHAENVDDEIFHVGDKEKPQYLLSLIKTHNPNQLIIFSNFKNQVERVAQFLTHNNYPAMGISSLLTQAQRNRVFSAFKENNSKNILVATDVAARGLDVREVDMVINYELPNDSENYVHRIGRTGRAGDKGRAFSLVSDQDVASLSRIEDYLKKKVAIGWLESEDLITDFKFMPARNRDSARHLENHKKSVTPKSRKKSQSRSSGHKTKHTKHQSHKKSSTFKKESSTHHESHGVKKSYKKKVKKTTSTHSANKKSNTSTYKGNNKKKSSAKNVYKGGRRTQQKGLKGLISKLFD